MALRNAYQKLCGLIAGSGIMKKSLKPQASSLKRLRQYVTLTQYIAVRQFII